MEDLFQSIKMSLRNVLNDPEDQATALNVKVSQNEIDKILKEYKRIKKAEKSNLGEVKKLGLTDQFGRQL